MVSDPVKLIRKLNPKLMDLNINTMMNSTRFFYMVILVYAGTHAHRDRLPLKYQGKMKQKIKIRHVVDCQHYHYVGFLTKF